MAKNYTFNEAVKIIAKGTDLEAITDIGRRYPVLAHKIAVVTAKAGEKFVDLMGYMPNYLTANKVNTAIKAGITESGSDEDVEDTEAEATTEDAGEDATEVNDDYDSMNANEIWKLMCERGLDKTVKSRKKGDRIAALREYDKNGGNTDSDSEDVEPENTYEGKSAIELFKECKARKIKVVPKKPAKFYADLLIKDDAAKAEAAEAESDEDDDWGDEEAEAPKKEDKKAAPKATAKSGKAKVAKKAEDESEDDEDWDI